MPGSPWPKFFWLKEIKGFAGWQRCPAGSTIWAAAGMTFVVAVLLFTVIGGLKYTAPVQPEVGLVNPDVTGRSVQIKRQEPSAAEIVAAKSVSDAAVKTDIAVKPARPIVNGTERPQQPVLGKIRQDFGWILHPVYNDWRYHTGIDIETSAGGAVRAMYAGEVTSIHEDKDYGLTVVIVSGPYTVYYGSLAAVTIAKGQYVAAGAKIGTVGVCSSESYFHLHLAIKTGGKYANPQELLSKAQ
jgi:murein DD-endopeptidase MepM/ murein hydrolase activator NlpD